MTIQNLLAAIGAGLPVPVVFQPDSDHKTRPSMEASDDISVFWNVRLQLFLQHDIHLQILPNAGRGVV